MAEKRNSDSPSSITAGIDETGLDKIAIYKTDTDKFVDRHIGPNRIQRQTMLDQLGANDLNALIEKIVPPDILTNTPLDLADALSETDALTRLETLADKNQIYTSLIGLGYHDTILPLVIQRNVLENPGWYTAYTPYQPEIAQGRLEGLLNYQQMIMDLSGMEMANASLLDEATAAAEAMAMARRQQRKNQSLRFFIDEQCLPQTLAVVQTRAEHFGFEIFIGNPDTDLQEGDYFAALLQYPERDGQVRDLDDCIEQIHQHDALAIVAADLMSLVLLKSPGAAGADIVVGSNQRFGIPMGFGGPHAGFFAFREAYKRAAPGRIIGVSVDSRGKPALRMAMQTREQHIRREKANSNICTSQVLLALISAFYGIYHGPEGLRNIATRIHSLTNLLATGLRASGFVILNSSWFDTLTIAVGEQQNRLYEKALKEGINLRKVSNDTLAISLNETSKLDLVTQLLSIFNAQTEPQQTPLAGLPQNLLRQDDILQHPVFNSYHSETEMLRYLSRLENRDMALNHSMIALGSCTMKLNATAEMVPITWPKFANMHPFVPIEQAQGYLQLFADLEHMLTACTGYAGVSLQPNAGSQGEYAGLIAIKKYHQSRGEHQRKICLIPSSAHGTNPASAHMAGMDVVVVKCDQEGNIDIADLAAHAERFTETLSALMLTYPSTHGVFEPGITEICEIIHRHGGQVYMDGANLNALVGIAEPGRFGSDVSHLNLHKTFCIPHGGGGPGMGPIAVAEHLTPFLPGHPLQDISGTDSANGVISAAPWGSASILPISWMYITMMGAEGMKKASQVAILNANYIAHQLRDHFPVLYTGTHGFVAHECIIDIRPLKEATSITEEDIAKRLMDYGYHAPTMSFPVAGTLMIEPTESEAKPELDRFIDAMIRIRAEIGKVVSGEWDSRDNPLKHAPHTLADILEDIWTRPYTRTQASHPAPWLHDDKVWPSVNRIDNVYGDRNLVCSCPPLSAYQDLDYQGSDT